jgi:hypothetical protein
MVSISKRAASVGAAVAMIATAGPVAVAGASTAPVTPPAIVASLHAPSLSTQNPYSATWKAGIDQASAPFQAGAAAAIGGWNAGAAAAAGGFSAGAAAMGLPFQFTVQSGPFGVNGVGLAPLTQTP